VTITPNGGPQLSATAEAFITPQGRSLVLTDGATPLLSVGDAGGAFGPPTAVGTGADGLTQFAGSSTFAEPKAVDSVRTGIDGVDVASAPNGDVAVSYRKLAQRFKIPLSLRPAPKKRSQP
jgi:hypothetical protein